MRPPSNAALWCMSAFFIARAIPSTGTEAYARFLGMFLHLVPVRKIIGFCWAIPKPSTLSATHANARCCIW